MRLIGYQRLGRLGIVLLINSVEEDSSKIPVLLYHMERTVSLHIPLS